MRNCSLTRLTAEVLHADQDEELAAEELLLVRYESTLSASSSRLLSTWQLAAMCPQ